MYIYASAILSIISIAKYVGDKKCTITRWGINSMLIYLTHGFIIKGIEQLIIPNISNIDSNIGIICILLFSIIYCSLLSISRLNYKLRYILNPKITSLVKVILNVV